MTTIEIGEPCRERSAWRLPLTVPDLFGALARRRAERRLNACLSRLPARLICDAGFDPDAVYDAVPGRWEEAHPGHLRIR